MKHIAYYISGHGYGHAVRATAIMQACTERNPFHLFHIKTAAPEWLFQLNLKSNFLLHPCACDVGVVQENFENVDFTATLAALKRHFKNAEKFVQSEANFLRQRNVKLVISDISPLAFSAAKKAGIPAIGIGNFTWDWIYQPFTKTHPEFQQFVNLISENYAHANRLLRLPFHGDMTAFQHIVDVPLVCRKAIRRRKDVRRLLHINIDNRPVVLLALREEDRRRLNLAALEKIKDYQFVFTGEVRNSANFTSVPGNALPFEDVINAADIVVSKPGYGLIADCISHQTPLLYTSREHFVEYEVLANAVEKNLSSQFLPPEKFWAGEWAESLHKLHKQKWPDVEMELNGAERTAEIIGEFV